MVINTGFLGSVSFSKIRTEFAGFAGSIPLSKYRIANGYTANHENNATIPTSDLNLGLSKWIGTDIDFESNSYTDATSTGGTSSLATNLWGYTTFIGACNNVGANTVGVTFGTIGTVDVVGTSKSSTTTTSVIGVYDWYYTNGSTPPPGTALRPGTLQGCYIWFGSANVTGSWWSSITANGVTRTRASSATTTGTFSAGVGTWWFWSGVSWSQNGSGTFTVTIVLT